MGPFRRRKVSFRSSISLYPLERRVIMLLHVVYKLIAPVNQEWNNTLSADNCAAAYLPREKPSPKKQWLNIYATPIASRLNAMIPGLSLTAADASNLMSLCGFDTAFNDGRPSPWCSIAGIEEWEDYEYWHDLEVRLPRYRRYVCPDAVCSGTIMMGMPHPSLEHRVAAG